MSETKKRTDTFSGHPESPGCLLCRIDSRISDADRPAAYLYIADMAARVGTKSWQEYTECCRKHAMLTVRVTNELNDVFMEIATKEAGLPAEDMEHLKKVMRRQFAALEEAVIARYDRGIE